MTTRTSDDLSVAVVVGASSGIGRSAAVELARRGAAVVLTYNSNPEGAQEAAAGIEAEGGHAATLRLDVGDSASFPAFVTGLRGEIEERWHQGRIFALVNNAGFGASAPFADTTEELFDQLVRVVLKGPFFLTQALLPLLRDGGVIVNTTSNSALPSGMENGYSAYASLKGGLAVLSRALAKELADRRIRVNAVAPGPTRTRIAEDAFERFPEVIPPIVERTALGRLGEPDDIGRVIASLVSDDLAWITGEQIEASGGFNL